MAQAVPPGQASDTANNAATTAGRTQREILFMGYSLFLLRFSLGYRTPALMGFDEKNRHLPL
jgi:hypothetical protein